LAQRLDLVAHPICGLAQEINGILGANIGLPLVFAAPYRDYLLQPQFG
jgi:hypothetical protein